MDPQKLELQSFELEGYESEIKSVARACTIGKAVEHVTPSYCGGLPSVDHDFAWPIKDGYPLSFIGQISCTEIDFIPNETGYLLFFYDNRHWGNSASDRGHAIAIHQSGERTLEQAELPVIQVSCLFGWIQRLVRPKVYKKTYVSFCEGLSFPSEERKLIPFENEVDEECYLEFCAAAKADIQIGGYPQPIQADQMESECVGACGFGQPDEWKLLLQLEEIGDMTWGDAGTLYWFIHEHDVAAGRFDRVWMITQCH